MGLNSTGIGAVRYNPRHNIAVQSSTILHLNGTLVQFLHGTHVYNFGYIVPNWHK